MPVKSEWGTPWCVFHKFVDVHARSRPGNVKHMTMNLLQGNSWGTHDMPQSHTDVYCDKERKMVTRNNDTNILICGVKRGKDIWTFMFSAA